MIQPFNLIIQMLTDIITLVYTLLMTHKSNKDKGITRKTFMKDSFIYRL